MAPGASHPQLPLSEGRKLIGTEDACPCAKSGGICTGGERADGDIRRCERCGHEFENLSGDDLCADCAHYNDGRVVL